MLTSNPTVKELRAELKTAMSNWKSENPAPSLDIEDEPELAQPFVVALEKGVIVFQAIDGKKAALHVTEHQTARRVELGYEQVTRLIEGLIEQRKSMKEHRSWLNRFKDVIRHYELENAAWNRRFMSFKESVELRLGIVREDDMR